MMSDDGAAEMSESLFGSDSILSQENEDLVSALREAGPSFPCPLFFRSMGTGSLRVSVAGA